MPALSVWVVRASLVYLMTGTCIGAFLLAARGAPLPPWIWALKQAHVEGLVFGFMVQFAFGVAFWILPRTAARRSVWPVVMAVLLLNAGIWLVAMAPVAGDARLEVVGRLCEAISVIAFAAYVWPRVRGLRRGSS